MARLGKASPQARERRYFSAQARERRYFSAMVSSSEVDGILPATLQIIQPILRGPVFRLSYAQLFRGLSQGEARGFPGPDENLGIYNRHNKPTFEWQKTVLPGNAA